MLGKVTFFVEMHTCLAAHYHIIITSIHFTQVKGLVAK